VRLIDPNLARHRSRRRRAGGESFWSSCEGGRQDGIPGLQTGAGEAVVNVVRRVSRPSPPCRCSPLYQAKKSAQWARPSSMEPNRSGKSGRYFIVLN
jgi:hypothetical protein